MILRTSMSLLSLCFLFGCTTTGSSEEGLSSRIKSYQSQIIEDEVTGGTSHCWGCRWHSNNVGGEFEFDLVTVMSMNPQCSHLVHVQAHHHRGHDDAA